MAIRSSKFRKQFNKLVRKPSILGLFVLLLSIIQDFVNHEFHERVFHSNSAKVIDGDTIVLDGVRIRLQGLDAPELKQTCQDKQSGSIWQCES